MDEKSVTETNGSSKRKFLYDSVLEAVKENSEGMEIGLVRAVLNEVDGRIAMLANRNSIDTVWKNERRSREKAEIQLYASAEDVLAESAERVEFLKGTEGMEKGKNAACAVETQRQQYKITSPDSLKDQKRDYLNLAKKFCIPISGAIKHYDTLSKPDI